MKDHPHLRGAAESYNSLKEAFLTAAPFVKDDGGNRSKSFTPFLFLLVAHHLHSLPWDKDYTDSSFHHEIFAKCKLSAHLQSDKKITTRIKEES